jgi:hypothetical protein
MIPPDEYSTAVEEALDNYACKIMYPIGYSSIAKAYRAGAEAGYNIIEASLTDDGK